MQIFVRMVNFFLLDEKGYDLQLKKKEEPCIHINNCANKNSVRDYM